MDRTGQGWDPKPTATAVANPYGAELEQLDRVKAK